MPRKGWRSVTVSEEVYEFFWKEWQQRKKEYKLKYGITSFTGFVTKLLYELLQKEKESERQAKEGTAE